MKESNGVKVLSCLVGALVLFSFYLLSQIQSLKEELVSTSVSINSLQASVSGQMSSYYHEIEALVKQEASLLENVEIDLGELNTDTLEVPVVISVTPKEVVKGLKVKLLVNDQAIELTNHETSYSGQFNLPLFEQIKGKVLLEDQGIIKTQMLEELTELSDFGLQGGYLLDAFVSFNGTTSLSNTKQLEYSYNGEISVETYNENVEITKTSIMIDVNGVNVYQSIWDGDYQGQSVKFDQKVPVAAGDDYSLYVLIEDRHGLVYKYVVEAFTFLENGERDVLNPYTGDQPIQILNQKGQVIYEPTYE